MKNTFNLTLFSITLLTFTVQSSNYLEETFTEKPPAIVTNTMIEIPEKEKRAEHALLKKGIDAFLKREFFDALISRKLSEITGHPWVTSMLRLWKRLHKLKHVII